MRFGLLTSAILATCLCAGATEPADTLQPAPSSGDSIVWYKQLVRERFNLNAPGIRYPKVMKAFVDVYNWGDRTFNTYDTAYVTGTGKNWKLMLRSYNWNEAFGLHFSNRDYLRISSDIFSDLGVHLSFMAVSIGYTADANALFGNSSKSRHTFNFNFVCALFSAGINYSKSEGGTRIRHFGDYKGGRRLNIRFNDISQETFSATLYYFGNHSKYSQGAAYNFSKYQLRSAGSWIAGLAVSTQTIRMDFSKLPQDMIESLPELKTNYDFRYADYDLLGGYGYNWVLRPRKWLINATVLPSIGYKHSYSGSTEGSKDMMSLNVRGLFSVVYNHRSLFAALIGSFEAHSYFASGYTFVNSINSLSLVAGVRF